MKNRVLVVLLLIITFKGFGQNPYFDLVKYNILSAKNTYKLKGNVKHIKNLKHSFDTEMFFSKSGFLTKTIHYQSLDSTRDTMYCIFDTLQNNIKKIQF